MTTQVDQVPVPEWAFIALGQPVEPRDFRYAAMLYPDGRFKDHWHAGQSVPDVSQPETKLWFYFLRASFIDVGSEAFQPSRNPQGSGPRHGIDTRGQGPRLRAVAGVAQW